MTRVEIRRCRSADLRRLEWTHELRADRKLIEWVFRQACAGELTMLVAAIGRDPIGQVWIDCRTKDQVAVLWALRVEASWRRHGIGMELIRAAEHEGRRAGARHAELAVERDNREARALYRVAGYRSIGWEPARDAITGRELGFDLELMRRALGRRER